MPRWLDAVLAGIAILVLAVPMAVVAVVVRLASNGPAIYWSDRVGADNKLFRMPKFRSMRTDTPTLATHLLGDGAAYLTPVGSFLRRTSIDELPQLWSILKGDMSFVGPRPALFNQDDLIRLRTEGGVHRLRPGLTGWAQINGRDDLTVADKAALDAEYLRRRSLALDIQIVARTFSAVMKSRSIAH